jgi:thiol-disulfide isomerase/thioredoxin
VPEVPRFPPRVLVASTVLALIAAVATYVILDGGDDEPVTTGPTVTVPLTPDRGDVDAASAAFTEFGSDQPVPLSSLRGKPVVVNFFASYCVPCITEMPAFEEVHQQLGDQVTFLGLAVADRKDEATQLVERTGVTYRTASDFRAEVITALGGTILPTTVLLDATGDVIEVHQGALEADALQELLAEKLGVRPPP